MMSIEYPWADETKRQRPVPRCSLYDLLRAYGQVQARFERRMKQFRDADTQ